jgi:hypothetical protein
MDLRKAGGKGMKLDFTQFTSIFMADTVGVLTTIASLMMLG